VRQGKTRVAVAQAYQRVALVSYCTATANELRLEPGSFSCAAGAVGVPCEEEVCSSSNHNLAFCWLFFSGRTKNTTTDHVYREAPPRRTSFKHLHATPSWLDLRVSSSSPLDKLVYTSPHSVFACYSLLRNTSNSNQKKTTSMMMSSAHDDVHSLCALLFRSKRLCKISRESMIWVFALHIFFIR
jgi:hypothetical protein